jgi:hypothetical protein
MPASRCSIFQKFYALFFEIASIEVKMVDYHNYSDRCPKLYKVLDKVS